jgi:hypothetical protein
MTRARDLASPVSYRPVISTNAGGSNATATYVDQHTVSVVCPPSGIIRVDHSGYVTPAATAGAYLTIELRQGATVIVGSAVSNGILAAATGTAFRAGTHTIFSALTPGLTYTVAQTFRSTAAVSVSCNYLTLIATPII